MRTEEGVPPKTLEAIYQSTWYHNPESHNMNSSIHQNFLAQLAHKHRSYTEYVDFYTSSPHVKWHAIYLSHTQCYA
jgi:hypothetical protein